MIALPVPPVATEAVALMQVGPNPSPGQASDLPIPHRRKIVDVPAAPDRRDSARDMASGSPQPDRLAACLAKAQQNPAAGLADANAWLAEGKLPADKVRANQCLGMILTQERSFDSAERAFADAVAGIPSDQAVSSVPLLGMAGNAALAGGQPIRAIDWFDRALAVPGFADNAARGALQADRARALFAMGRLDEVASALDEAHRLAPDYAEGWLLSATLARHNKDLARAQRDIEMAAKLNPADPAIGLEAGAIAVMDGRNEAARKSWSSVIALAPQSDEAKIAQDYLEQLGPAPTSASAPPTSPEKKIP